MIAVVDYKIGNLYSISKALERLGEKVVVTDQPSVVSEAEAVVLPGVGSFGKAMENLEKNQMKEAIREAQSGGKALLGICLGLQLLFEKSKEAPRTEGLSLLSGEVVKLPPTNKVPHIGWNQVYFKKDFPLAQDIPQGRFFYFAHSFYVLPEESLAVVGICNYNVVIPAIINQDNIWGFQFYPEKSSTWGMKVLESWLRSWKK